MKNVAFSFVIFFLSGLFTHLEAQKILQDKQLILDTAGDLFNGTAQFKFLISSGETVLWSNDGSCTTLSMPSQSVVLDVKDGIFKANLGTPPMKIFYKELIHYYADPILTTWVNCGNGFSKLNSYSIFPDDFKESIENHNAFEVNKPKKEIPQLVGYSCIRNNEEEEKSGKEATNPDGWVEQWKLMHAGKDGKIPFDGLVKAKQHIDQMPANKDAGITTWEWLGPGNIGGRIRAIAIKPTNPDIIFIGSVAGGIWKSIDAGSSWTVVNDFLPNLAVTSIVYDPTNLNNMYASTGEGFDNLDGLPGAGIFKSVDGGTNWSQLSSTNSVDFSYVNRLAHHPDSTGILFAVTSYPGQIVKSIDGGGSWTVVLTSSDNFLDVKISPHSPYNLLIAGTQGFATNFGEVYISTDWGKTWTLKTTGTENELPNDFLRSETGFCLSNATKIYLSNGRNDGEIWQSDDQGVSWVKKCTGFDYLGNQQWYSHTIWVDPTNSNNLVVGGIDLWRSIDGGTTLTKISRWQDYHNNGAANSAHADQHIIISHPDYNGTTNRTVYFGNDGGIQKANDVITVSENAGWTNLSGTTLGITQFYGGAASPDGSVICGGAQDNDQLRYHESGDWSGAGQWFQSETGDGGYAAIDPTNSSVQYSEYVYLDITKSTNGGDTWVSAVNGLTDAGNKSTALFIAPFVMDPNDPDILVAGGNSIWRTIDAGANWSTIRFGSNKCTAIDIAKGNSNIIWIGDPFGNVKVTTDAGVATPTWTDVDDGATPLPDRYVTDIAINPINSNEVYVTFGEYQADNVWFTSDGGTNWFNRSGTAPNDLPALQVNTVRVHPRNSNYIYIGTDLGVFASEDKGLNWAIEPRYPGQNNELPANVAVSELFWQGDDYLIAATHGRGMYRANPISTIYVDKNASPGGNGSKLTPYQTVTEAVNAATPGSAISIKSNTYDEPAMLITTSGIIVTTNGSTIIK